MATAVFVPLSAFLRSPSFRWAVGGWSFFIAENVILSENRGYLIQMLGDEGYHAAYGTLSTAAMVSVAYAYRYKLGASPYSSGVPLFHKGMAFVSVSLGLILVSQTLPKFQLPVTMVSPPPSITNNPTVAVPNNRSFRVQCPFDFTDKKLSHGAVHGIERITRHPGLWSMGFVGLGQSFMMLGNPAKKAFWCMPLLVAWIGGSHTDSRHRRGMGGTLRPEEDAMSSNVPLIALLRNAGASGSMSWDEFKVLNAFIAVAMSGLWVWRTGRVPKPMIMAMAK